MFNEEHRKVLSSGSSLADVFRPSLMGPELFSQFQIIRTLETGSFKLKMEEIKFLCILYNYFNILINWPRFFDENDAKRD